jgi:predicted PurR-regulated permease PerM
MAFSIDRFYRLNRKAVIWVILFGLIYLLRDLFGLIFLIFIIGFFTHPAVNFLNKRFHLSRDLSITFVYAAILVGYVMMLRWVSPTVVEQVNSLRLKLPKIENDIKALHGRFMDPDRHPNLARKYQSEIGSPNLAKKYPNVSQLIETLLPPDDLEADIEVLKSRIGLPTRAELERRATGSMMSLAGAPSSIEAVEDELEARLDALEARMKELEGRAAESDVPRVEKLLPQFLTQLSRQMLGFGMNSFIAILFSYLISLSHHRLADQLRSIKTSRLRDFYEEAGQPVVKFALAVGRGVQALVIIALLTTAIMVPGLLAFRLPSIQLLAVIVFFTSLIPVVGIFFEVVPIALVALNAVGLEKTFGVMVWVLAVHLLVGYVIGPFIFGRQFRMNLVLVLIILFLGERFFGLWGLILGVPVASYVLREVLSIRLEEAQVPAIKDAAADVSGATPPIRLRSDESPPPPAEKPTPQKG